MTLWWSPTRRERGARQEDRVEEGSWGEDVALSGLWERKDVLIRRRLGEQMSKKSDLMVLCMYGMVSRIRGMLSPLAVPLAIGQLGQSGSTEQRFSHGIYN